MQPLLEITWLQWLLMALVLAQTSIFSITLHLHRSQAHRALDLHPAVSHVMRAWLWLTTGMSTREWVGVHRKHHALCETVDDPHSPKHYGLWKVVTAGALLYTKARSDKELVERYSKGVPMDWLERNVYVPLKLLGPTVFLFAAVVVLGFAKGLALCAVLFSWSPVWAAGVINGLGHAKGYRNFATPDESRNLVPWGLWIGGEELHNNHHAHATSAKLSYHWWEVDIGWGAICVLRALGLAKVRKAAAPPILAPEPRPCSRDLLEQLAQHQPLIGRWFNQVWADKLADLRRRNLLTAPQAKSLKFAFWGDTPAVGAEAVIQESRELQTLRAHWTDWRKLWTDRHAGAEELTQRLEHWCLRAESSGEELLRAFSQKVRRISPQPA